MDIYTLAQHYDHINDFDYDIPLLLEYAKGRKTLELACGTARVAIPLAKAGVDISGVDVSKEMLAYAKEKTKKEQVEIKFYQQDIINLELEEKFDFIFCIHNSFSHIDGFENVKNFFENLKKHLNPKGIVLLQVFTPDFYFFTRNPNEKFPLKKYQDPKTNQAVELLENSFYDDASQINYFKWYFRTSEKEELKNWHQRVYYPQELDYIVQFAGFKIVNKFGDWDKTPFEEYPDTQILVLEED